MAPIFMTSPFHLQEALTMGSMDDQSLFDSYDNQKVPTGKPSKLTNDPWSAKKRSIDSDFDDFHMPPTKRASLFEDTKPDIEQAIDDKRVIVPAGEPQLLLFFQS